MGPHEHALAAGAVTAEWENAYAGDDFLVLDELQCAGPLRKCLSHVFGDVTPLVRCSARGLLILTAIGDELRVWKCVEVVVMVAVQVRRDDVADGGQRSGVLGS